MKASIILFASALTSSVTAWSVNYHTRSNIEWDTHGTSDVTCNTLNWPSGKKQEDVESINFDASTDFHTDPTTLTVYPGQKCGDGGVKVKPGVSKPGKGFYVGSYSIK